METLPKLKDAIDALIVATAASLKEAHDTDNAAAYKILSRHLVPVGEFAVDIDEIES